MLSRVAIASAYGHFAEAERLLARADVLAAASQNPNATGLSLGHRGLMLIAASRHDELPGLPQAFAAMVAKQGLPGDELYQLQFAVWSADRTRMRELTSRYAHALETRSGGLPIFASCAELLGDRALAARLYDRMRPWSGRYTCVVFEGGYDHVLARLATQLGRDADARRHHEDDLAGCRRIGARAWQVRALLGLAGLLQRSSADGDQRRAAELRAEARTIAAELGIAKLPGAPAEPDPVPHRADAPRAIGLTFALEGDYWTVRFGTPRSGRRTARDCACWWSWSSTRAGSCTRCSSPRSRPASS